MKIAVLMSTYNGEAYLKAQIDSILAQEGVAPELWVRDDGSADGTPAILEEYARKGQLRWFSGENKKPARSFWELLCRCEGYDFYAFADQDDIWYPDKLSRALEKLAGCSGPGLYAANARMVDREGAPLGRNVYRSPIPTDFYTMAVAANVLGCTCVFNEALACALRSNPQPEAMIMHDSYAAEVCAFLDGVIVYDHRPGMDYRQHGKNVVGSQWKKTAALADRIRKLRTPAPVSIADQTAAILKAFAPMAKDEKKVAFLHQVADYRKNFASAVALACSRKPKFSSRNMEITLRLATALRNR